ncbi:glycosyltransferase family 2 protein [Campylobacter sp. 2018MI35]|uniref:glycosyltransferase family 2 protein n=1 Tax=Campylobacter sp. 2018MI34 TaxID=2800582 RepID=UPI0019041BB9|nr:glycosyltransferase family 2 protein [Campylobacter sp. 2018MI34]MBK1992427.1 glycosyltransferase family 2 protein [Campylobacter sp. 2018MI34]
MNKTVGVVIPIYNVEKYLKECLDSVINQTYKNLQVILVNDGSTDKNSFNIAKEYTLKDERLILFDKKNGGHSSAKNVGIEYFSGEYTFKNKTQILEKNSLIEFNIEGDNPYEIYRVYKSCKAFKTTKDLTNFIYPSIDYIIFLDSDDYWELDCIEKCVSRMNGINVLWFDYKFLNKNKATQMEIYNYTEEQIITPLQWLKRTREIGNYLFWYAWQGMIDFTFLQKINIKFINQIIHEDHHFGIALFSMASSIYIYPKKKYIYRVRKTSISNQKQYNIDSSSYLYSLYLEFDKNTYELKRYQMSINWILTSLELIKILKYNLNSEISTLVEQIFLPTLLDKTLIIFFINKDPLLLKNKLKELKNYFMKFHLSKAECLKYQLPYRLGYFVLMNYKNLAGLAKIIFNIKKIKLKIKNEEKLFEKTIKDFPFIVFSLDEDLESKKIKKHYSYRLGKFLEYIVI